MNKSQLIQSLKLYNFPRRVIEAFEKVEREKFIPEKYKLCAYEDIPLPIGNKATISQPYTIAFMLNLLELKKGQKILEIGSGSGYVLALLAEITKGKIFGVEIIKELAENSKNTLKNYKNIKVINKSGKNGLIEHALYDRILISATAQAVPNNLTTQLKKEGILVAPVKNSIIKIKKSNNKITTKEFPGFAFVPLQD